MSASPTASMYSLSASTSTTTATTTLHPNNHLTLGDGSSSSSISSSGGGGGGVGARHSGSYYTATSSPSQHPQNALLHPSGSGSGSVSGSSAAMQGLNAGSGVAHQQHQQQQQQQQQVNTASSPAFGFTLNASNSHHHHTTSATSMTSMMSSGSTHSSSGAVNGNTTSTAATATATASEAVAATAALASTAGLPALEGRMHKWTNYLHGWQERYVQLSGGVLSYFKSQADVAYGCRGSMNLREAVVLVHPYDELRFDVALQDSVYYLRTQSNDDRERWVEAIETSKTTLIETMSISSAGSVRKKQSAKSLAFAASLKAKTLKERLSEMESYRDILGKQSDQLLLYYEQLLAYHQQLAMASVSNVAQLSEGDGPLPPPPPPPIDENELREEVITYKATSSGMVTALDEVIQEVTKKDEEFAKRYEHEVERRRQVEVELANLRSTKRPMPAIQNKLPGPDMEEGPHSSLKDDEFFDAVEASLDKNDAFQMEDQTARQLAAGAHLAPLGKHRFADVVTKGLAEAKQFESEDVEHDKLWSVVLEENTTKVWRREIEDANGALLFDRLRAHCDIPGVSGREVADVFYDEEKRHKLEDAISEHQRTLELLDTNTYIQQVLYKKVWPAAQREAVCIVHLEQLGRFDWAACCWSVDHKDAPADKYCRVTTSASLICRTRFHPSVDVSKITDLSAVPRDKISAHVMYTACVNPGGWAPITVVRAVAKREYPKFLRRIEQIALSYVKPGSPLVH
ncbi:hypothetical protein CAOG_06220 [Capsaspora owczarzaki ATCC 30864]|nr:hypothetical protein CAOG_06220 [Capsaspora owczarzaki ATCC 30864]|eukprot:XP_004344969.2 hypothetical protein CAOG_06220 [Capsaspora owczarzaki ATCC 30864]